HRLRNEYDLAIEDYDRAIQIKPNDATAIADRGMAEDHQHDFHRALMDYDSAIALDPHNPKFLNARCWLRAETNSELSLALADCNASLALAPNVPNTFDSRGAVYFRQGRYREAIADFDTALRANSRLSSSLYVRGLARCHVEDCVAGRADIRAT